MKAVKKLSVLAILLTLISCNQLTDNADKNTEREAVAKTIDSCIGWFKEKNFDLLYSVVADDSNYISVRPSGVPLRGYDQFIKNSEIYKNPTFTYVRHELKDLTINFSKKGDVAWFYCILDDFNEWDGKPANWENARWTGVLEKRNDKWVIVQQHFSFARE